MRSIHLIPTDKATDAGLSSIITDLKTSLTTLRSEVDLQSFGATIDQLLQATRLSPEERSELLVLKNKVGAGGPASPKVGFWEGISNALCGIDGERFAKTVPTIMIFSLCTSLVLWLLWHQSVGLYAATGFPDPKISAAGAILMIIGFSAFHGLSRSKLTLLPCLYAGGYEALTIILGTVEAEGKAKISLVEADPKGNWLREQTKKAEDDYRSVKSRWEDPSSKIFQNQWYKNKYVDSAWNQLQDAQEKFFAHRNELIASKGSDHATILKVLYRLGLVFLSMLLVHRLVYGRRLAVLAD